MTKHLLVLFATVSLLIGCAGLQPGSDPIIVRSQQVRQMAHDTFDAFLKLAYNNRERLLRLDEGITDTADNIRANATKWHESLNKAVSNYRISKAQTHATAVTIATDVLEGVALDAKNYSSKAKAKGIQ